MKKGFTLVEVIAVIILLSLVSLIVFPSFNNILKKQEENKKKTALDTIYMATENYIYGNYDKFKNLDYPGVEINIKILDLIKSNYLDNTLINPYTGEKFIKNDFIKVSKNTDGILNFEYIYKDYYRDNSGANIPELFDNMIAIKFDGKKWIYADESKEWYDYNRQEWANAVVLNNEAKLKLDQNMIKYGDEILDSYVDLWFVWIPRYKYKLFNADGNNSQPQEIFITFENDIATSGDVSCKNVTYGDIQNSPLTSENCINDSNGNWYTHPAFTIGTKELSGFWAGKFEISNTNNKLQILPNKKSLLQKSLFEYSQLINNSNVEHNLNCDSHIIRNMEWGAIAYLSQSKYGLCKSNSCSQIRKNNNSAFLTGYGAISDTAISGETTDVTQLYNTIEGMKSSTTQNIYGIYDMSGGAWEYTLGNMVDSNNNYFPSLSGFLTEDAVGNNYFEKYTFSNNSNEFKRGKLGDATKETKNWYDDYTYFPTSSFPWTTRGGNFKDDSKAGLNAIDADDGGKDADVTSRVVLCNK